MKYTLWVSIIVVILVIVGAYVLLQAPLNQKATLANPASVFCINNGGRSEITTAADGSQGGMCVFANGTSCDEWAFYRGECKPGGQVNNGTNTNPNISPNIIPDITPIVIGGQSGVKGTVTLSPVCPVEKFPPDPACAPKPYSTSILILEGGATVKTIQSGADGTFSAELSPGAYTLRATGGSVLPRCAEATIQIRPDETVTADISCDSGIR
jgi:putative hemolysin